MKHSLVTLDRKNALPIYSAIHILFWVTYALMISFASVFLQNRGFSNSQIGLVLGCTYATSACLQPTVTSLFGRLRLSINHGLMCTCSISIALSLCLLLPLPNLLAAVLMVLAFGLHSSAQPSINSLSHAMGLMGVPVNFGFARALGSVGFAIITSVMGVVLSHMSPALLPLFYIFTLSLLIFTLSLFHTPACAHAPRQKGGPKSSFMRDNPRFMLFLAAIICICLNHEVINSFMLQVMQNLGGGSQELGIAVSVGAMIEVPVMMFFSRIRKKIGLRRVLLLCGWGWFCKNLITAFAATPTMVYGAQLLQALGYALYIPMMVDLVGVLLPEKDYLKGIALAGSAYTSGGIFASFTSGVMMDAFGVTTTLRALLVCSLTGAILLTLVSRQLKPQKQTA